VKAAPFLFISPFILAFTLFLGPAIYALIISFFRYAGYGSMTFVGLYNYFATLQYRLFGWGCATPSFIGLHTTYP
jgi:ABC-type sugar transport system permease subunit